MFTKETLIERQQLKTAVRHFFSQRNYLEVETPALVTMPGTETHLGYFETHWVDHKAKKHKKYLRSSPEIHLKKLLCQGMERIYEFATCFRNEGEHSNWHRPEFTMLEWYQKGITFSDFMNQTEDLFRHCHELTKSQIPLPKQIIRITVEEAFERWAHITLVDGDPELAQKAKAQGNLSVRDDDDFETAFFKILLDAVEPELAKLGMVFLYDYPESQAALAQVEKNKAKRFELYIDGIELCNAFLELSDWQVNLERIRETNQKRARLKKNVPDIDHDFIEQLKTPMGHCCGNALGFERLHAILFQRHSIAEVNLSSIVNDKQ